MIGDIVLSTNAYDSGGSYIPADGRVLPLGVYPLLFSILGIRFGGNGQSTFAVPDLRPFTPQGLQYSICAFGDFPSKN
jgi:microcystin-dependent protein